VKRWSRTTGTPAYVARLQRLLLTLPAIGTPWVLLVTGSREAEREVWGNVISDCLDEVNVWLDRVPSLSGAGVPIPRVKILRHGGAPGIDTLAHIRARPFGYQPDRMPADWRHWGRRSGIIRNQQMVDKIPRPHLCLAFFAEISKGTADCAGQARAAGIPTLSVTVEDLYLPHS
jgi:hypothetical protein